MKFEWDDAKREAVWRKHRVDFAYVIRIFDGITLEWEDRRNYAETRIVAVGLIEGEPYRVVYQP